MHVHSLVFILIALSDKHKLLYLRKFLYDRGEK